MIVKTFCKIHGEGRFNVVEGAIVPTCCRYAIIRTQEETMEKELKFEHIFICLQSLMQKGACDEGVLWYSKKYIKDGNITPTLENLYKEVPKQEWRNWLLEKFSEHIKIEEPEYCCKEFANRVHNGWIVGNKGDWYTQCRCKNHNPAGISRIIYCFACGKKLEA